jgi:DNA mismatch repair protein MutS2
MEFEKIIHRLEQHASTTLGKEHAAALRPVTELDEVKRLLQGTDEAALIDRLKGAAPFGGIRDIRASLKRARVGGMLNAHELLDVGGTIGGGRKLKRFVLAAHEKNPVATLAALAEQVVEARELEEQIRRCIDDNGVVLDSASPELSRIRHELRTGEARVRERLEQMIRNPSVQKMLQDNLVTMRGDRYVIPVKQEYRGQFGGLIHDQSASGATLFIEPESVVQLNNKLRELKLKEEQEIEKILRQLTVLVAAEADELDVNVDCLGQLDFLFAKAGLAREMKAVLPLMNDRGFLKIRRGRHPLIPADRVVPLDVELGNKFTSIIVTGPNTGGKTVVLKTVGLLELMAMSGLFVPAEESSQLCVFDGIFADIGDEQSIEQSLSTFSSHMTNIIRILRDMTPKSLVLLDELGAGTDPAEGSALAIAILEHVHAMGCRTVATTHYSELKAYAYDRRGVTNASMEFDIATLSPTYRLLVGIPGRSNAFAIAERLGLSKRIIEDARGRVGEDEAQVESMIATLEESRASAESERQTAEQQRREVENLRAKLDAEREKFAAQRDKLLAKAEQDARETVAKARREAEEIIADLRKMAMEEQSSIKEHRLIDVKRRLDLAEPETTHQPAAKRAGGKAKPLREGDEVRVVSLGQKGQLVELSSDEAVVQLGMMKMKVPRAELELVSSAAAKQQQPKAITLVKRSREASGRTELDLRGQNLEEAMIEVDRFLDESLLSNLNVVSIIHGKGTGVLRSGITEFLRKHKHVKGFRLGEHGEGGNGVTVVELG